MKYNIPFIKPSFPKAAELVDSYKKIVNSNWFTNFGPQEQEFSDKLGKFIGDDVFAVTVNNATIGLVAAILAILGKGDNSKSIIMPSFTFVAGAQAIAWCGYRPYFVDVREDTLQIDNREVEKLLKKDKSIVGILHCNVFGIGDPNIDKWEELSLKYNVPIVIDSAAGFGSQYSSGHFLGAKGSCEVFSFHATKPFAIGEGGAVTSKDKDLIEKIKSIINFGFAGGRDAQHLGFNGKLQELNAAIGLKQLENFPLRLKKRQQIYNKYHETLSKHGFMRPPNADKSSCCFASFVCPPSIDKDALLKHLNEAGVYARDYYNPPLHRHEYVKRKSDTHTVGPMHVTDKISSNVISLPIHDNMKKSDITSICGLIDSFAGAV